MSDSTTIDLPAIDRRTIDRLLAETTGGYMPIIDATASTEASPLPVRGRRVATEPVPGGVPDEVTVGVLAELLARELMSGPEPVATAEPFAEPFADAPFFARRVRPGRGDLFRAPTDARR